MTALTIVVASVGASRAVRSALQDWSGVGLVDRFLWLEPARTSGGRLEALQVEEGRVEAVGLNEIAGRHRWDLIRLIDLRLVLREEDSDAAATADEVSRVVTASFGGVAISRIRAIIARADEVTSSAPLATAGWHNIVLSPEQSAAPGVGRSPLDARTDQLQLGIATAAALAGLAGLWAGIEHAPLDREDILPGQVVRLSRSYYRNLGTRHLEAALRRRVLSTENGLPLPTQFGASVEYVEDSELAAATMADQLWQRHAGVLQGPRETVPLAPVRAIGAQRALQMFFGFLWAVIRNTPRAWVTRVVTSVKSTAASAVHSLVFGSAPSAYAVVVRGVTASGQPASWLDYQDATAALDQLLDDPGTPREHEARTDLSTLWHDYAAGAFTLADGGERVLGLSPVQIGPRRGVLRRPALIVPSATAGLDAIPPHLAASVALDAPRPFDVLGAQDMGRRLRQLADQPALGVAAAASLERFGEWWSEHSGSFAVRVGSRLGQRLQETIGEIKALLDRIRTAADPESMLADVQAQQRRLARTMGIVALVFVALVVVAMVLGIAGVYGVPVAATIIGGLVVAWFLSALLSFVRGQRELFALITRRKVLMTGIEVDRRNLRLALRDARRLSDAYGQFLAWSRVLGAVLEAPFGRPETMDQTHDVELDDLPLSVGLGTASAADSDLAAAATKLRQDIFSVGWLSGCWDQTLSAAPERLSSRGIEVLAGERALFASPGQGADSILVAWADELECRGVDSHAGDEVWAGVLAMLNGPQGAVTDRLLRTVDDSRSASGTSVTYQDFMGRTDQSVELGPDRLDDSLLTDNAQAGGRSVIERSVASVARAGLGRVVSLTQFSTAFPEYELRIAAGTQQRATARPDVEADPSLGEPTGPARSSFPELFDGRPF